MAVAKASMEKAVDRFLRTGAVRQEEVADLARACDRRVRGETQRSTVSSIKLGRTFVRQARGHGGILYLTALRSLGWALLVAGDYRQAENTYLKARSLVVRQPLDRARIDRILIDVYMYLGRYTEAYRRSRLALATFKRLKSPADIAKTEVNYANVLHRQDRHKEANRLYRKASDFFAAENNPLAAALCDYNLANTYVQLFEFESAAERYHSARNTFLEHDQQLYATGCLYGLAWLHMLQGEFHTALLELSECEAVYRQGDQTRELVLCLLDRSEAYLGLNLFLDARKAAEEANRHARRLGIEYEAAKADFFSGKACIGLGQKRAARTRLMRAERGFEKLNNQGFFAAVQFAQAQQERPDPELFSRLESIRSRFRNAQLPLWEAICDLQIAVQWPDEHAAIRRLKSNPAVASVPHLQAHRYVILGDRQADRNHWKDAVSSWSRAAEILDAVRAKLPPVELRSSFFHGNSDPFRKLIDHCAESDPLEAAAWSERHRTAGMWGAPSELVRDNPVRRKIQQSLTELAAQVTTLSGMLAGAGKHRGSAMSGQPAVLNRLQTRVRNDLLALERAQRTTQPGTHSLARQIHAVSQELPVVQFHLGDTDILGFVHYHGATHCHRYTDGADVLENLIARWRFHVEIAPTSGQTGQSDFIEDEGRILRHIGEWLLLPLELPTDAKRLLIFTEGQLSRLPWQALSRGGRPLAEDYELVLAPSLQHFLAARESSTRSQAMKIFVGQTTGLPHAAAEVAALKSKLNHESIQVLDPCRRSDWPDQSSANIWHFVGHAYLRSDNPFYSALQLADGPLFAVDFRLRRNRVNLVTLAACRTGQHTALPGQETTGLVRSLLEMGARNVVATTWAVSDESTLKWTDAFYTHILHGLTPAAAVRLATLKIREEYPSAFHWGAFAVAGAG